MAVPLVMPLLGSMTTMKIKRWLKSEGETIKAGEIVAVLSNPCGNIKYKAPREGTLLKIIIPANKIVQSGSLIGIIGTPGEDLSAIIEFSSPIIAL